MRIALAQFNPIVGDIDGNTSRMAELIDRAAADGGDLVVFGELSVVGYPPRDLLRKSGFVARSEKAVQTLAEHCHQTAALVGFVRANPLETGRPLQNAAAYLADGQVQAVHVKSLLPTYDVFDETRYFQPAEQLEAMGIGGHTLGVSICEDLWDAEGLGRGLYPCDPIARLVEQGAEMIINLAASPFEIGKASRREALFARQADRNGCPIVYVNQVGGNDELIFDGGSCVVSAQGEVMARARFFAEDLVLVDLERSAAKPVLPMGESMDQLAEAIRLGLRDYVVKCGFEKIVLGLSGGVDSALVAALGAQALGAENVQCIAMPSRYSSEHSLSDAEQLAKNLGCPYCTIPIETMHHAYEQALCPPIEGPGASVAWENIQSRIRGNIVMAWSNAFGHLPIATGNKSELSVGYCTLYGDMSGGLAPIGDLLKTEVYALCRHLNAVADGPLIPQTILDKPPSAELKPGQVDQDKLPDYEVLDAILRLYVEQDAPAERIVQEGFDPALVYRVVRMVDLAEYKRQQAARVLKVSARAFGMGRRVPIAQRFVQRPVNDISSRGPD